MSYIVHITDADETLDSVVSVNFEQSYENESTIADIVALSPDEVNQKIGNDENIEIEKQSNGNIEFIGKIKEINKSDDQVELSAEEEYTQLHQMESNGRVFYKTDSGDAIESLITQDINSKGKRIIDNSSNLTDKSSNAPVFELGDFSNLQPHEYGTNLLFAGFPVDSTPDTTYNLTYSNITPNGEEFTEFETRMIINNLSGVFSIYAQYIDSNQKNYVWDLGSIDGVTNIVLNVEEAQDLTIDGTLDSTDSTNTNKFRFIFQINGQLVEDRAIGIDALLGKSVEIVNRPHDYNTVNIPQSGRTITRKFTNTVASSVYKILEEEEKKLLVDSNKNVIIKEKGENTADLEITEDTPIINFEVNTNSDEIRNKITVEGSGGVFVEETAPSSIQQFGFTKTKKIRDKSIKHEKNAREKAITQLEKLAFKDTKIIVELPNVDELSGTSVGDKILINYENIDNYFTIQSIEKTDTGFTKLVIDAETVRFNT